MCAFAFFLAGCAGYHLGPVNGLAAGDKSIEVLPFNNQTLEPRLGEAVTESLRERLQVDGTYHLASGGDPDIVVSGVITGYSRQGLGFLNTDVSTVIDYRIGIVAHVIARDSTGKILLDKKVNGFTLVRVGTDLADAERQSLPLLAEDLAQNVAQLLTEGAW